MSEPVVVAEPAADASSAATAAEQWLAYTAPGPKSIVDLQPFRHTTTTRFGSELSGGTATLIDLNPTIQDWYLLALHWNAPDRTSFYALENPRPRILRLVLDPADPYGLQLVENAHMLRCLLWRDSDAPPLQTAVATGLPYAPLCGDTLYLRNRVAGAYTHLERVTNFLRDHVWGGDQVVGFVKRELFVDAYMERSGTILPAPEPSVSAASPTGLVKPLMPQEAADTAVMPEHLGIDVGMGALPLHMGGWYPVTGIAGMFLSLIQPEALSPSTITTDPASVNRLDPIESAAVDYVVAMDLAAFDLGFALGTDHPRVSWSQRIPDTERDAALPGPDGFGGISPLVTNGIVNPRIVESVAATFAGGFKREHGAFHSGLLAHRNHGSHYGFIEQGVMFSKLQPGLATLVVMDDGHVLMKTWTTGDDARLRHVRFARQNGVALIEYDETTGKSSAGVLVNQWGPGNWSGSLDEQQRTLRAGLCLEVSATAQYLLFGYFSTATPSSMTKVFQAYGCRYAMHLDMNALEHTYFAVYTRRAGKLLVEHLITGMGEVDRKGGTALAPRFLSFPDDRDFFYLTRKEAPSP